MTKALYLALLVLLIGTTAYAQDYEDDEEDVMGEVVPEDEVPSLRRNEEYVSDEDQEAEFFEGIKEDTMMQQVISDMNGLEEAIERERLTRGGNVSDLAQQTLAAMKRFADLKKLVSWLQPKDKRISRYCFYGCWCLPEGAHGFVAGTGRPVDNVDKACMYLWFCYTCAKDDFGTCNPNTRRYSYKFKWNPADPDDYTQRGITCTNGWRRNYNKNTVKYNCARAICECDRGLAMRLYKYWTHWAKSRHRIWSKSTPEGLFIVEDRCISPPCGKLGDDECPGAQHQLICCGRYHDQYGGSRFPTRDHEGRYECCPEDFGTGTGFPWYGSMFNKFTHECENGVVQAIGG